jgi:uncharacterized coiled-coil protein SlyX
MKRKYLEMKLAITEREIQTLESRLTSAEVNLRQQKEKRWQLIEQLERLEVSDIESRK